MVMNETSIHKCKTILRNFSIHKVVLQLIHLFDKVDLDGNSEARALVQHCYRFFEVWCRQDSRNQQLVHDMLPTIVKHVGLGLHASDALASCLQDNVVLLSKINVKFVSGLVSTMLSRRKVCRSLLSPRYLKLLCTLLSCRGQPLKKNQNIVLKVILNNSADMLLLWSGPDGHNGKLEIVRKGKDGTSEERFQFDYHIELITLLAMCCQGANPECEIRTRSLFSFRDLMTAILETELMFDEHGFLSPCVYCAQPATACTCDGTTFMDPVMVRRLRAAFLKYVHHVYIDSSNKSATANVCNKESRVWMTAPDAIREGWCSHNTLMSLMQQELEEFADFLDDGEESKKLSPRNAKPTYKPQLVFPVPEEGPESPAESEQQTERRRAAIFYDTPKSATTLNSLPIHSLQKMIRKSRSARMALHMKQQQAEVIAEWYKFVYDVIVPLLVSYFEKHYGKNIQPSPTHQVVAGGIFAAVFRISVHFTAELSDKEQQRRKALVSLLQILMFRVNVDPHEDMEVPNLWKAESVMLDADRMMGEGFLVGLSIFLRDYSETVGLQENSGLHSGVKRLAHSLCQNSTVPGSKPATTFRELVFQLITILRHRSVSDNAKHDQSICLILQLVRAMIFLENPIEQLCVDAPALHEVVDQLRDRSWNDFTARVPLCKEVPEDIAAQFSEEGINLESLPYDVDRVLKWVQSKYSDLGATVCGLRFIASKNLEVQQAALSLLNDLMHNGNTAVQATVEQCLLHRQTSASTFNALREIIGQAKLAIERHRKVLKKRRGQMQTESMMLSQGGNRGSFHHKTRLVTTLKERGNRPHTPFAGTLGDILQQRMQSGALMVELNPQSSRRRSMSYFRRASVDTSGSWTPTGRSSSVGLTRNPSVTQGAGIQEPENDSASESTTFVLQTLDNVLELMRLMRWMAEGHHTVLQNYMRFQHNLPSSYAPPTPFSSSLRHLSTCCLVQVRPCVGDGRVAWNSRASCGADADRVGGGRHCSYGEVYRCPYDCPGDSCRISSGAMSAKSGGNHRCWVFHNPQPILERS